LREPTTTEPTTNDAADLLLDETVKIDLDAAGDGDALGGVRALLLGRELLVLHHAQLVFEAACARSQCNREARR